jgi:hypothetical protein
VYCLIKDVRESMERIKFLKGLYLEPFAQPFRDYENKIEPTKLQRKFARWVNHTAVFNSVEWEDFEVRGHNNGMNVEHNPPRQFQQMCLSSTNNKTSKQSKTLTESEETPIIAREALLSLVEWLRRRPQHERAISGDSGTQADHSGGAQAPDHCSVRADDPSPSERTQPQRGDHSADGS